MRNLISITACLLLLFIYFPSFSKEIRLIDFNISAKNKNNTSGFLKLSTFLKDKSNITINFPKGVYYVGLQEKSSTSVVENINNILIFENCSNIKINGNGATIKFVENLLYGSFEIGSKKKLNPSGTFLESKNAAYPGNCINILNSSNITITNLNLDGNINKMIIGGKYGDTGIQLWHRGLYIINSNDIVLSNLNIHHFGLDGIEIANKTTILGKNKYQVQISNTKSLYNGRQGISWTGGNGLLIKNSNFSHTGKSNVSSAPGCGIDIEPEVNICINGLIINCKFENNASYAFGSDYFGKAIKNIVFTNCTLGGTTSAALFPSNGGLKFENCIIYGQIIRPSGISINERVQFENCKFYDYNPITNIPCTFVTNHLIDAGSGRSYYDFINNEFFIKKVKLCYIENSLPDKPNFPNFEGNKVYFLENNYQANDFIALFRSCVLRNNIFEMKFLDKKNNGNFILINNNNKIIGFNKIIGNNQYIGWGSNSGPKSLN